MPQPRFVSRAANNFAVVVERRHAQPAPPGSGAIAEGSVSNQFTLRSSCAWYALAAFCLSRGLEQRPTFKMSQYRRRSRTRHRPPGRLEHARNPQPPFIGIQHRNGTKYALHTNAPPSFHRPPSGGPRSPSYPDTRCTGRNHPPTSRPHDTWNHEERAHN